MHLIWRAMSGVMPRIEPHLLPEMNAQQALNTILWTGGVASLKGSAFVAETYKAGEKLTIFRDGQHIDNDTKYWLSFNNDVDITRGPVVDDELGRLFYTGDGVPKTTNSLIGWADPGPMPVAFYNLGIPAPTSPPIITVHQTGDPDAEPVTILVAYAYVTADGFIGPISPVSAAASYLAGQQVDVSDLQTGPSGAYNLAKKYLYVAQTDADGATALRFWQERTLATTVAFGEIDFTLLGEEIDSPSLIPPPDDMFGIMKHPNGFMVAFTTRKYLRSEIFKPHGWPSEYQDPIADDIVGGAIIDQQVIICTKKKTYSAIGIDPLNQSIVDLAGTQPCVSKRSIKAMPFGVLYAGADGLVIASNPLTVVSEAHFTREQWQALNPSSMFAVTHDRRYHLFWKIDEVQKGSLIFEFEPNGRLHTVVRTDQWYSAGYNDERRDELYVAGADGEVYKWDAGTALTTKWRSREMRMGRPENVGAVRIIADAYPVKFTLFDRNLPVSQVEVFSERPERLHGTDRYDRICWEVETTAKWTQVEIASSIFDIVADG